MTLGRNARSVFSPETVLRVIHKSLTCPWGRKIKEVFSHRGLSAVRAPVSMRCESSMEEQACHDISLAAVDLEFHDYLSDCPHRLSLNL